MSTPSILIATHVPFWNRSMGSEQRVHSLINSVQGLGVPLHLVMTTGQCDAKYEIAKLYNLASVHFPLCRRPEMEPTRLQRLARTWWGQLLYPYWRALGIPIRNRLRALLGISQPAITLANWTPSILLERFSLILEQTNPTLVIIEYIYLHELLKCVPPQVTTIIDTHDLMHMRNKSYRARNIQHTLLNIDREAEKTILEQFDAVVAIQNKERDIVEEMVDGPTVIYAPHAHEIRKGKRREVDGTCRILFVGGKSDFNYDALAYFLKEVVPHLSKETIAKCELHVVGQVCEFGRKIKSKLKTIYHSFVDDLDEMFDSCEFTINPVRIGSGLKIKAVESLCNGRPILTTSIGAEGMEDGIGLVLETADTAEEFAEKLTTWVSDSSTLEAYKQNTYNYAMSHFSQEVAYRELLDYIRMTIESLPDTAAEESRTRPSKPANVDPASV